MSSNSQRIIISCLVISLVICACTAIFALGGAGVLAWSGGLSWRGLVTPGLESTPTLEPFKTEAIVTLQHPPTPPPSTEIAQTELPTTQPQPSQTVPVSELPASIARQMDRIQEETVTLRGLDDLQPVKRVLLTADELRQHVIEEILNDYGPQEAKEDTLTLSTFGLLSPDFDLYNFYVDLYSEQVAGYYDNEAKAMYVVQSSGFKGLEKLTYAHEYTHALQDQHYDIENGLNYSDSACEGDSERCTAAQALIEGDASLLEEQWLYKYATPGDINEILDYYDNEYESKVFDASPKFMKEDFLFPYTQGLDFVRHLYDQGGWTKVDDAYQNLPMSSEQILHPDRYPGDKPEAITIPDLSQVLGTEWRSIDQDSLGEWYTYLVLAHGVDPDARLNDEQARQAAEGWGGDAYRVYLNDQNNSLIMVLVSQWDNPNEAVQFAESFEKYGNARFGQPLIQQPSHPGAGTRWVWQAGGTYTEFRLEGALTTWVLAPNAETADQVLHNLQN